MLDKFQEQHVYITSLILVNIDDSVNDDITSIKS